MRARHTSLCPGEISQEFSDCCLCVPNAGMDDRGAHQPRKVLSHMHPSIARVRLACLSLLLAAASAVATPVVHAQSQNSDPRSYTAYVADRWYLDDAPQRVTADLAPRTHDDWALQLQGVECENVAAKPRPSETPTSGPPAESEPRPRSNFQTIGFTGSHRVAQRRLAAPQACDRGGRCGAGACAQERRFCK